MSTVRIEILKKVDVSKPNPAKDYQQMIVTHTDLSNGKTDGKKLVDFRSNAVWGTLLAAQPGDVYKVERAKNDKGYWEWTGISKDAKSGDDQVPTSSATSQAVTRPTGNKATERVGSWETPDERAARQVYIVRQSSISSAVEILKATNKPFGTNAVITLAKELETYVFGAGIDALVDDQPE
jgi:hypothetical protein